MRQNTAGQVIGVQMVSATDGSAFTGAVTVLVTGDGGVQATGSVGAGACTHEGNGFHTYAPAQAETNYSHIAFTFIGTGAIPVTVQVYPTFPQTGDSFARLGAPAGASLSADVATVDANVDLVLEDTGTTLPATLATIAGYIDTEIAAIQATLAALNDLDAAGIRAALGLAAADLDTQLAALPTAVENADALLGRSIAGGASTGRTVTSALRRLRNRVAIAAGTMTVYQEDDATSDHTAVVTTTAGDPISEVDPA